MYVSIILTVVMFHRCVHMSKFIRLYILNMYSLLNLNYNSVLKFKKDTRQVQK